MTWNTKKRSKRVHSCGRVEITGWVALEEGTYDTHTIKDKGVQGIPLTTEDKGVKGLPETFMSDSTLIIG
jgi:hypothetical protein